MLTNVVQFPKKKHRDLMEANAKHRLALSVHRMLLRLRNDEPLTEGERLVMCSFADEACEALNILGITP